MFEKSYGFCTACGEFVYREHGKRHGDGQFDTEDNPVWLLTDVDDMTEAEIGQAEEIQCGCTA
jgi:hypothetical protein